MVERILAKDKMGVRFPLPAPIIKSPLHEATLRVANRGIERRRPRAPASMKRQRNGSGMAEPGSRALSRIGMSETNEQLYLVTCDRPPYPHILIKFPSHIWIRSQVTKSFVHASHSKSLSTRDPASPIPGPTDTGTLGLRLSNPFRPLKQ